MGNSFMDQLVYVRYLDHVLFKDIDPHAMKPQIRETVGWLAEENENHSLGLSSPRWGFRATTSTT
jgi:hypothetical protein